MKTRKNMPTVGRVAGVRIMIFFQDHAPPHVHAEKGEAQIVVAILDPKIPAGVFTTAEKKAVLAWIRGNRVSLLANWALAQTGHELFEI